MRGSIRLEWVAALSRNTHLTPASHSGQVGLWAMIDKLFEQTPELARRCKDFSAGRSLDCAETKAKLWDENHIRPLIDIRELWRS